MMRRAAPLLACALLLGACATTIDDGTDADQAVPAGSDVAVETTDDAVDSEPADEPVDDAAAALLPEFSDELSRLGTQVADGEGDDETLAVLEQIWQRLRPEIESDRPDLLNGLDTAMDMARISVNRTRPADADKALSILTDVAAQFTAGT